MTSHLLKPLAEWTSGAVTTCIPELCRGGVRTVTPQLVQADLATGREGLLHATAGSRFIRLAGLSGGLAIYIGAYGSHTLRKRSAEQDLKDTFEIASYYHFIHSLALLAVPITRRPCVTGTLMMMGMTMFCGTCYYHALTGDRQLRPVTPYGAFVLILAWLSLAV